MSKLDAEWQALGYQDAHDAALSIAEREAPAAPKEQREAWARQMLAIAYREGEELERAWHRVAP